MRKGIVAACLIKASLAAVVMAQNPPTTETHKAWMDDAADAQEDFRDAMAAKNAKAAAGALTKIEGLMARTEAYWAAKEMNDGVKLTRATRTQASAGIGRESGQAGRGQRRIRQDEQRLQCVPRAAARKTLNVGSNGWASRSPVK
jgi:hypothetical protein